MRGRSGKGPYQVPELLLVGASGAEVVLGDWIAGQMLEPLRGEFVSSDLAASPVLGWTAVPDAKGRHGLIVAVVLPLVARAYAYGELGQTSFTMGVLRGKW
jgi:hypothetical protein